ncbi:glycerate kinase family protein [Halanaerobium congolense]|uniref:Glycerate kinase n=1 Tax=Halanaerobium congolense TaxID=54121 RepID=A0A1G6RAV2_9FIRM|nr:glycerate kinase [Halanaerobium congolense]PUU89472.1 MAG: glycerate kinase [Halanaerobium sp.]TDP13640.1 glycerate kinase [Halanaerobium congolense]SDD01434.1 glycerate kinase [Halanaerobium congolense]SDK85090.1 glycerate kinase [Halanaerobium congolense]SDM64833.1 glycerate kinase [Halanaerobium congolense]
MRILVAPDSFKGSLTAMEVAKNIKKGINSYDSKIDVELLPMADGGEGTVQSLVDATNGEIIEKEVNGPLGNKVKAFYGLLGDQKTAVIEMAAASGLPLVPEGKKNPLKTTTYGTGELIASALDAGAQKIIIGIGGSATNDAGVGMAQALGAEILDAEEQQIDFGGGNLDKIEKINLDKLDSRLQDVEVVVACDVDNPLYGKDGAAYVYAPQKGADPEMVKILDQNLRHFNQIAIKELNKDINKIPGAGAAGGLGAGLVAFLDAELKAGVDIVLDIIDFESYLKDVDLVITGEGMLDGQSIYGKTPVGVSRSAAKKDIPVIAIAGTLGEGVEKILDYGINSYFSIIDRPAELKEIIEKSPELLANLSEQIIRTIQI